jgi:hypothetical protein
MSALPPDPPPATIVASTSLVPGCIVTVDEEVFSVTVHFPKEVTFFFPITPPFALAI